MTGRRTAGSLLIFVLLLFAPLPAFSQERVRLAYPARSLSALHIRVAEERGFYRKYGLEVEAIQIRPTVSVVALLSGEVQYLASVGSAIRSAAMGAPIKIVSVALTARSYELALPAISQEAMVDREGIRRVLEMETESGVALKLTRPEQITEGRIVEEAGSELSGRSR